MCGKRYINENTGPAGYLCNCVYIMEHVEKWREIFLTLKLDEATNNPVLSYGSYDGGRSLKSHIESNPDSVRKLQIDYGKGPNLKDLLEISENLQIERRGSTLAFLVKNLYECFLQRDAVSISVAPLIVTEEKLFYCANPRITVDPRSHYRQASILTQFDPTQMSAQERIA